jgi:hypothetical protein
MFTLITGALMFRFPAAALSGTRELIGLGCLRYHME